MSSGRQSVAELAALLVAMLLACAALAGVVHVAVLLASPGDSAPAQRAPVYRSERAIVRAVCGRRPGRVIAADFEAIDFPGGSPRWWVLCRGGIAPAPVF